MMVLAAAALSGCVENAPPNYMVQSSNQAIALAKAACPDTADNFPGYWEVDFDLPYWNTWHWDMVSQTQYVKIDGRTGGVLCPIDP